MALTARSDLEPLIRPGRQGEQHDVISQLNNSDTGLIRPPSGRDAQIGPARSRSGKTATCPARPDHDRREQRRAEFANDHAEGRDRDDQQHNGRIGQFASSQMKATPWDQGKQRCNA